MKKSCSNCTHTKKRINQMPCRGCFEAEHWEPMTNAQLIRSMSDEELADFLNQWGTSTKAWQQDPGETMNWLQQPAGEEEA